MKKSETTTETPLALNSVVTRSKIMPSGNVKWKVAFIDRYYRMNVQYIEIWGHCENCVSATFRRLYPEQEYSICGLHQT